MEKLAKGSLDINDFIEYYNNNKKHLKGYMFDSLVYRYQLALYKAILYDHKGEDIRPEDFKRIYNRDLMRFIEILDEAIGEHD
jgi:hypothetical protein